jgi:hypothetical protein
MVGGLHIAPHHGLVAPPVGADFVDGPIGGRKKRPRSIGEWPHVARGVLVPDIFLPCTDASGAGALIDTGNNIPFTANNGASGAVAFQVALADWTGFFAGFGASPVNNRGFRASGTPGAERGWDPNMAIFGSFLIQITATGGSRTLFTLCSTTILQQLSGGNLSLFVTGSTVVNGVSDYRNATSVHHIAFLWDPIGSSPLWRVSTSLGETLSVSNFSVQGTAAIGQGFGGSATPPTGVIGTAAFWLGSNAIYMGDRSGPGIVTPGSRNGAAQLVSEIAA